MPDLTEKQYPQAWSLWLQTGWNDTYRIGYDEFVASWDRSPVKKCVLKGEELIAIARANTDGVLYSMIYDVVVHKSYRGQGYGRVIVEELLRELELMGVRTVQLMAAQNQADFYGKLGFSPRLPDRPGMHYVREDAEQTHPPDAHERAGDA